MKRLLAVAGFVLLLGGCASTTEVERLENRVEELETNLDALVKVTGQGLANQQAQQNQQVSADRIEAPSLCTGQPAVWNAYGPGLTC